MILQATCSSLKPNFETQEGFQGLSELVKGSGPDTFKLKQSLLLSFAFTYLYLSNSKFRAIWLVWMTYSMIGNGSMC